MTPSLPTPTTWWDYAKAIPNDAPDTVYDSAREHFYRTVVEPKALQDGYDTAVAKQGFMEQSQRPGRSAFPRTELVAKEALSAFGTPLVNMMGGDSGNLQRGVERAREEATRQGINKPLPVIGGPYSFVGQGIGMAPYFAAGELAAAPLLGLLEAPGIGAAASKLAQRYKDIQVGTSAATHGLLLKEGMHAATVGAIQGSYDAAVAPEGKKIEAFGHGAVMGTAIGAGFGLLGGLAGSLRNAHPDITPKEAAALDSVAKGVASPEELDLATAATFKTTKLEDTVQQAAAEGQKTANTMGVPKEVKLDTVKGEGWTSSTIGTPQPVADWGNVPVSSEAPPTPNFSELTLPADLAGAKPNYGYRDKQFTLQFETDLDRAAYISAQTKRSARDADFVQFATEATGLSADEIRAHGSAIRSAIKDMAKDADPGNLAVPDMTGQLGSKAAKIAEVAGPKIKISMIGADGQPYTLGGAEGIPVEDMDANIELISQHLQNGGSIVELGGQRRAIQSFLRKVEISNAPDEIKLPIKAAMPGQKPAKPVTVGASLEYRPNMLVREFLEENPDTTTAELEENFSLAPGKAQKAFDWWQGERTDVAPRAARRPDTPGAWISPEGNINRLEVGEDHFDNGGESFEDGWIRHRGDSISTYTLDNPNLTKAVLEASKEGKAIQIDYDGTDDPLTPFKHLTVPREDIGEFLANPKKYARAQLPRASRIDDVINSRDSYYHATSVEGAEGILGSGEIRPGDVIPDSEWENIAEKQLDYDDAAAPAIEKQLVSEYGKSNFGVSVSRVPRVASKAKKGITFVIDRKGMPKNRPFTEPGYQKTAEGKPPADASEWSHEYTELSNRRNFYLEGKADMSPTQLERWHELNTKVEAAKTQPNETFEFEQRTYNEPISLKHVKGVLIDREALLGPEKPLKYATAEQLTSYQESILTGITSKLDAAGIPYKILDSGKDVHSYRAGLGNAEEGMRWSVKPKELGGTWTDPQGNIHTVGRFGSKNLLHGEYITEQTEFNSVGHALDNGWIRQRGDAIQVESLDNPQLIKSFYEAVEASKSGTVSVTGRYQGKLKEVKVSPEARAEFLNDPVLYFRKQLRYSVDRGTSFNVEDAPSGEGNYAVTSDSIPGYDKYEQLPTGEVLYKPTGEIFENMEDAQYESALDDPQAQGQATDIDLNGYDAANGPAYDFSQPPIDPNLVQQPYTPHYAQVAGSGNVPLSLRGREQATKLGELFDRRGGLDELHSSNIPAADQTAQAILQTNPLTKANMPSPELDSWSLASMEGHDYNVANRESIQSLQHSSNADRFWLEGGPRSTKPIGETYPQFTERISQSIAALEQSYRDNPRRIGVVVSPDVIEQLHTGGVDKSFNGHYDGVYRYAPNEEGSSWGMRRVDMEAASPLKDGIYLIAHTETPYSKSAKAPSTKVTPLGQRTVGSQKILSDYKAEGLAVGKNIFLKDSLNRGALTHERYHAMTHALDLGDEVMQFMDHPETTAIYDSGFSPVTKDFYGLDPSVWREEVYAHSLDAIRVNNEYKIQQFIDADTSREVYMGWFRDMTQAHLDAAATRGDSVIKRMYERTLNDASNRSTRHLADINNYFSQGDAQVSLRDGHWITEAEGVTTLHNNRMSALTALEEQEPSLNIPELVDTSLLPEGTPRFSRRERPPDGSKPGNGDPLPFDLGGEPSRVEGGLQLVSRFFRPFTGWLNTVAEKNDWPELFDTFSQIDNGHIAYNNLTRPYVELLKETLGQASPKRQQDFYKWFEAPTTAGKTRVEEALLFTPEEKSMLSRFQEEVLSPLDSELGASLKEYVHDILPKIRAAGSVREAFPRQKGVPGNFLIDKLRTGGLDPKNENLLWLAGKYLEYGAKHKTLKPAIDAAEKLMYEKLEDGQMRAGNVLPLLQRHIDFQRGIPDYTNQIVKGALEGATEMINRGLEVVNAKLPKSMQIPSIGELSNDPLGKFTLFQYAGTLGLKPSTVIRDAMQYFITTLPVAGKYALKGMQRVYPAFKMGSEEAKYLWDTAQHYGALIERNDLASLYSAAEDTTQAGEGKMTQFATWSMKAIQLSHNSNRLAAFWGHTEQATDAITSWRRHGDLKKFSKDSGLWFLDKGTREQFLQELPTLRDPKDFTHRVAARMTEATQWNFRRGANPGLYESSLGRLFGQYGTWPLNYIEFARKFASAEDRVASREGLTRLVIAHGAILAAGQSIGIDTGRWVFTAPATDWSGGPLVQHMLNAPKLFDIETKEGDEARHELRRDIFPGLIPGGVEAGRLYEAIVGDDPDGWVKTLGFHVMDNGDYNRGLHQVLPGQK